MAPMMGVVSSQSSPDEYEPPEGYERIEDILQMESKRLSSQPLVNVIGIVRDFQPPVKTRREDYKCTINIFDFTTQVVGANGRTGIDVSVFYPLDKMPRISAAGDIVLLRKAKVQMYQGFVSLLTNFATGVSVFKGTAIPPWPVKSPAALNNAFLSKVTPIGKDDACYIVRLNAFIDKSVIPTELEFQQKVEEATHTREKYSLFKDLVAGQYYDLIGEVIRVFESDGRTTMYLSDYTAHTLFYNQAWMGVEAEAEVRDGDEYNYIPSRTKKGEDKWPGPYGKLSLQLTAFDAHAAYVAEEVKAGDWVKLTNVQVKMGKQGGCLEGYLRGDRNAFRDKIQVQVLKLNSENKDSVDTRWKDAVKRKLEYRVRFKTQKDAALHEVEDKAQQGKRRPRANAKNNSKKRRLDVAAAVEKDIAAEESRATEKLGLNPSVKCAQDKRSAVRLSAVLDRQNHRLKLDDGREHITAFTNAKYRTNVRVLDYWPHDLTLFCVGRKQEDYDMLSDYSGGESTDNEENMKNFREGKGFGGAKKWEWRFSLLVTDAMPSSSEWAPQAVWVTIDNSSGITLFNLEATNLHSDTSALDSVRSRLFTLWGDLEERKSKFLGTEVGKALRYACSTPMSGDVTNTTIVAQASDSEDSAETPKQTTIKSRKVDSLPPDSDDENALHTKVSKQPIAITDIKPAALSDRDININASKIVAAPNPKFQDPVNDKEECRRIRNLSQLEARKLWASKLQNLGVQNKGFPAILAQYGIKVPEEDEAKADAGEGVRWQRMFALVETWIV